MREELTDTFTDAGRATDHRATIQGYLDMADSDLHYTLARLRMDLETELRRILGKRMVVDDPVAMQGKFRSATSLFRQLVQVVPRYTHMEGSFKYVLKVCNAALHGQRVPDDIAYEALDMGVLMLKELESHER